VENRELVDALNDDLATELKSIVQYVQHIAMLKGAEYVSTIAELNTHVTQELQHALTIAQQVDFLGGVPTTTVPAVPSVTDTETALKLDLQLEESQLDRYRERTQQAMDAGLPDVAEALRPLLEQTQEHVRDLRTVLETP
jgi:bacterioferritin